MSKNREQKHAQHLAEKQAHEQHRLEAEAQEHHDHFVEAPKGTSRARFLFNFLLVVFLLVIFSVTGPMMSALTGGGGGAGELYASWTLPNGETHTLTTQQFYDEKRAFAALEPLYGALGMQGIDPGDDYATARFLILEDMAREAGVFAPSVHLSEFLLGVFGSQENYAAYVASRRSMNMLQFERLVGRALTVQRYLDFVRGAVMIADPAEAGDLWATTNKEYLFQYVKLETADFLEEAQGQVPPAQELQDWFDALPPFDKAEFNTQPSWSAELAWFDTGDAAAPAALFERFPRPEDEDAEQLANDYYASFSHVRFKRPANEDGTEPEGDKYLPFDEVADAARREAPIYYSLVAWLTDLQARVDQGEVVDIEVEAGSVGLRFQRVDPRTRDGWLEGEEPWSGAVLAGVTGSLAEGRIAPRVVVEAGALVVPRVLEKLAPTLPPFEEIRDKAAERWAQKRSTELAVERLEALRTEFLAPLPEGGDETQPRAATADLAAFEAAVAAAGLTLEVRDYKSRYPRTTEDPTSRTPVDTYLQNSTRFYTLEEGGLAEAEATRDGKQAYLVRFGGSREASLDDMDPEDLQRTVALLSGQAGQAFARATWDNQEWVKQRFELGLKSWTDPNAAID